MMSVISQHYMYVVHSAIEIAFLPLCLSVCLSVCFGCE